MSRIALTTLGCKANWVDGEDLLRLLAGADFEIVPFKTRADVYVINTCTVTSVADGQSRQMIRKARRTNPRALVLVTGCMGEVSREDTASMPEVDAVFGTSDRSGIVKYIREKLGLCPPSEIPAEMNAIFNPRSSAFLSAPIRDSSRARAFFKIQEGCNKRCAYCIVPRARGKSRSVNPEDILRSCMELARHHKEIVLTGINIGQYGADLVPKLDLIELLDLLAKAGNFPRIRISSIDPAVVDERLVELIASGKICRHVHLSIQSGSNPVLCRMGRKYSADEIRRAVNLLAENIPQIAIGGDIIAGFPGETDDEHKRTLDLISNLPLASLHVFPYSERKETAAWDMTDRIPHKIRCARAGELRDAAAQLRHKFLQGLKGSILDVIVTSRTADECGMVSGFSDNAVSVSLPAGAMGYAQMGSALVTEVSDLNVKGIWKSQEKKKTC